MVRLCYVYVIASKEGGSWKGPAKVGIASNPGARALSLQTGNHRALSVVRAFPFASRDAARDCEKIVHLGYSDKRLKGEWFDAEPSMLIETIEEARRLQNEWGNA